MVSVDGLRLSAPSNMAAAMFGHCWCWKSLYCLFTWPSYENMSMFYRSSRYLQRRFCFCCVEDLRVSSSAEYYVFFCEFPTSSVCCASFPLSTKGSLKSCSPISTCFLREGAEFQQSHITCTRGFLSTTGRFHSRVAYRAWSSVLVNLNTRRHPLLRKLLHRGIILQHSRRSSPHSRPLSLPLCFRLVSMVQRAQRGLPLLCCHR